MRRFCLVIGFVVLAAVWLGPLPALAGHTFSAHMTMHMGVVAVAAAFLAWGMAGARLDPSRRWPSFFSPIAASLAELVVVWSWHAPGLHAFARGSDVGFVLEQGSFLLVGLWLWLSAFGGAVSGGRGAAAANGTDRGAAHDGGAAAVERRVAAAARARRAAGMVGLLFTSMHMTLLGALLALTPRVLYDHMTGSAAMTALEDQHLGGAIMLLVGGVAYLGGGLYLTATLMRGAPRAIRTDQSTTPRSEGAP